MAAVQTGQGGGGAETQSSFPLPPMMYISKYTDEAIQDGSAPKPPSLPNDSYMMFGQQHNQDDVIIRPLELQGLQRLHPQVYDRRKELKKLTVSILCNFLDLLDILVNATGSQARDKKIEDLNMLFIHIHHLINEFRPHQARETLKVMMKMQQAQMLDVGERLWKHIEKAGNILSECANEIAEIQSKASSAIELLQTQEMMDIDSLLTSSSLPQSSMLPDQDMNTSSMETENNKVSNNKDDILTGLINDID